MNALERLYQANQELDKVLKEVEVEQLKIKEEVTQKRTIGWEKMFEDLYSLRKYSNLIDTGIGLCNSEKETLGFDIRDNNICVISFEHFDCIGKPIEPRIDTYFFTITKDKPFETDSLYRDWMKYVIYAVENWDEVMKQIEIRLLKRMELDMKKKISNSERKQLELENQLKAINH